ncbi:MAG: cupredoxin domain-containing protein [Nitrospiraceae bacterium]
MRTVQLAGKLGWILLSTGFALPCGPTHVFGAWATGEVLVDYGIDLREGETAVIADKAESGESFDAEITWRVDPRDCLLKLLQEGDGDGLADMKVLPDDRAFGGTPAHSLISELKTLLMTAQQGHECHLGVDPADFVSVARRESQGPPPALRASQPAIGATVVVRRATTFFSPGQVTIKTGERVVWVYADGAKEPHTVTSGGCPGHDCSGGGKEFNSGVTLTKPGDTFAHTFTKPGIFEYHCELHASNMRGTVRVTP